MADFVAQITCPHCKTQKSSFTGNHYTVISGSYLRVPLSCSHCQEMVIAQVTKRYDDAHDGIIRLGRNGGYILNDFYPRVVTHQEPKGVPERILSTYLKAIDNRSRTHYDVVVMLCGKVLDLATKDMDQTWSLEKRLKKLASDGKLAPQMSEWAEEIRLDRNVAAHHDDEFTQAEADQILGFTEAFLTYLYSLPEMIHERRRERDVSKPA